MAVLVDSNTVRVERGDTLYGIARKYGRGMSYTQLANINGIKNPNLIYVNQIIKLSPTAPSAPAGGTPAPAAAVKTINYPTVLGFGLQSSGDTTGTTLIAIWNWNRANTDHYEIEWYYATGDTLSNGELIWFVGSKTTTTETQSTYSYSNGVATQVRFRVKAVSQTHEVNNNQVSYWTGDWSAYNTYKVPESVKNPPETPATPTVEIKGYTLTASLDNLKGNNTQIAFEVLRDDSTTYKTGSVNINSAGYAAFSCSVVAGSRYKVRARGGCNTKNFGWQNSDWSDWSSNVGTIPAASAGITQLRASSETSIYLEWAAASGATSYDIEYATKSTYFDNSDQTSTKTGIENTHFELSGLTAGNEYFFRVRAVNNSGHSSWSGLKSVVIGKEPSAPTTWSSTTTVITGEKLILYWVHNAQDSSSQTFAELEIIANGNKQTFTIKNTASEEDKDKTSSYEVDTSSFVEGVEISWRVRTAGITMTYGDWSTQRVVHVYAPPVLTCTMLDNKDNVIHTLEAFPFYISGFAGPKTQEPIGYHISIKAKSSYETTDSVGNFKMVNAGEEVYSKHFDTKQELLVEFSANNIDLENNVTYIVSCTVSMNSGLTATDEFEFDVTWSDANYSPNAEISLDSDTLTTYIRPYCEDVKWLYYKVTHEGSDYITTEEETEAIAGIPVEEVPTESVYTTTGEQVYSGDTSTGETILFCVKSQTYLVEDVELAVYRREFDGSFTEVAKNVENNRGVTVTDPHPALDLARYRIVVTVKSTGAVSFSDLAGYPIGEKSVIIQWDEDWTQFETSNEDEMEQPPWAGSLLKLPYNIDVSDKHDTDVSLVKYAGRKRPVSYYGTQLGETSSWKVEIPKSDKETLYAIRRLSIWTGDVYVREPSGTGYWANMKVSYDINHCELTIPVSFDITRVEGGL